MKPCGDASHVARDHRSHLDSRRVDRCGAERQPSGTAASARAVHGNSGRARIVKNEPGRKATTPLRPGVLGYHRILAAGARVQLGTAYTLPQQPKRKVNTETLPQIQ